MAGSLVTNNEFVRTNKVVIFFLSESKTLLKIVFVSFFSLGDMVACAYGSV